MAWNFIKTDSIADLVAAIYGKSLNFIKTDSATDPVTAIYSIGLTLYKKQTLSQPAAKKEFAKYVPRAPSYLTHLRPLRALIFTRLNYAPWEPYLHALLTRL